MTNSREIKKALTRAFKGVKFKVTTRNVLCETITVEWTGYPFINQVQAITDAWNTFQDHSDSQTDYFFYTGTEIEFKRKLSQEEIDFVVPGILDLKGNTVSGVAIDFYTSKWRECFAGKDENGNFNYQVDCERHNKLLKSYLQNGMSVELDSYEAKRQKDNYLYATDHDAWLAKIEQDKQQKEAEKEKARLEFAAKLSPLVKGDYNGSPANDNLDYIVIHGHEGVQAIETNAKFASFKSANDAIRKIFDQYGMEWRDDQGYYKLDFSIHFTDGQVYANGRLDLSPREDNPFNTDNVIGQHCVEFLEWQIASNNDDRAKKMLKDYSFEDIAPKPSNVIQFPQKTQLEAIEVDEPVEFNIPCVLPGINAIEVDEPEIKPASYFIINKPVEFTPVEWVTPAPVPSFQIVQTAPKLEPVTSWQTVSEPSIKVISQNYDSVEFRW